MTVHGQPVNLGATKVRGLLAVLAYKCDESVPVDYLADALWDDDRPAEPAKTLQVYVSRLRGVINRHRAPAAVINEHDAYRLRADPSSVDHRSFVGLVRSGHRAQGRGQNAEAAQYFASAVDLWYGAPFTGLRTSWAARMKDTLVTSELLPARGALVEAKLALGEYEFVLDRLPPMLADHPHEERLASLWMRVLAATERSDEIPTFFREFTHRLEADLDAEPSSELTDIYQISLRRRAASAAPKQRIPSPPRAVRHFVGRVDLLASLDRALLDPARTATVVALDGRAGVGKTALVRQWARLHQDEFPDGVLYRDLAGYASTAPEEPGTVLGMFLTELASRVPNGLDERAAMLRHALAGRRVLVILDNARDSAHVRTLLLAMTECPVLVTSRRRLTGIAVRDGAERLTVPELSDGEARTLLSTLIGERAATEPVAVGELVALCERLPLAVQIVGQHVASRPGAPLRDLAGELRQANRLLDAGDDDTSLRSAFSWSYRALPSAHGRLFRVLGLFPTARFDATAVASAAGLDRAGVDSSLDALVGAHLVEQERAGRYRMHDLVHQYAVDSADRDEPEDDREKAVRRLLGWYVDTARNARRQLTADPHDVPALPLAEPVTTLTFDSRERAKDWFDAERGALISLARDKVDEPEVVWRIAACLNVVHDHDLHELLEVHELGRRAAARAGQHAAEAGCLISMGVHYGQLLDNVNAISAFEQAYAVFEKVGDAHGKAASLHNIGSIKLRFGKPAEAIGYHERALEAFSATDNAFGVAAVHRWLADDFLALDRHDEAYGRYLESLRISEELGDERSVGVTLNRLTQLLLEMGNPERAVEQGLSALVIHDRTGDRGSAAEVLCTLAAARVELKAFPQAVADATEAVRAQEQLRNEIGQAVALETLGRAHAAAGERHLAIEAWSAATELLAPVDEARVGALKVLIEEYSEHGVPGQWPDTLAPSTRPGSRITH
jgi:DNA-binding SARP family transcriptional activator/tetratricopeptide (TPR) repeat protein